MKKNRIRYLIAVMVVGLLAGLPSTMMAAMIAPIAGEIEHLTLNNPSDVYSGGTMVVGGQSVIIPKNLLIDLPANRLSLQQIFTQAPAACVTNGESGLAKADKCNISGAGAIVSLTANVTNAGNTIAGDVFIEKGQESVTGKVTYIDHTAGYFRVNGVTGDAATGIMVRLNDPTSRHSIQQGAGCAGVANCSADPRFGLDPDNYVIAFSSGYPVCIPSTVARQFVDKLDFNGNGQVAETITAQGDASGVGDLLCPSTNRTMDPNNYLAPEAPVADSRRFAPLLVGDSVTAEGNFETINGVHFLSAHTMRVNKALSTRVAAGQPDYMFLEEVFVEAPGFQNQRARAMWIGFTSLDPTQAAAQNPPLLPTDVDIWSIHRDPATNAVVELPMASVTGCDAAAGAGSCSGQGLIGAGANIFRIRYDVDFLLAVTNPQGRYPGGARADLNPCWQLQSSPRFKVSHPNICGGTSAGITLTNNMGIMSPVPHEIQARTGRKIDDLKRPGGPTLFTLDINGNDATNGQYLFPLGMNLGGIEVAEWVEIDLNQISSPLIFEGIPWNLDRRLSPSGCLKGGCENDPLGTYALDPFPFSGLDPRTQADFAVVGVTGGLPKGFYNDTTYTASQLDDVRNRVFSYVDGNLGKFNGNTTVLPYVLGTFPADPALIPIDPTPVLDIFPPIAVDDTVITNMNTPITIDVLGNDIPVLGGILAGPVTIVANPGSGNAFANPNGTVTFTPANNFSGTATFQYTIKNNFFAVSNAATVTVNVIAPATGVTITPVPTSPQDIGTNVVFIAAGAGGTGIFEYEFSQFDGNNWITVQPYSRSNAWVWNTTGVAANTYATRAKVRSVGSTAAYDAVNIVNYTVAVPVVKTLTMAADKLAPQPAGNAITFTASATGGVAPLSYEFWLLTNGTWAKTQSYSPSNTWSWTPATQGTYQIQVRARSAGSNAAYEAYSQQGYLVTAPPVTSVTVTPDKASPQFSGTTITFTAAAVGGLAPQEYEFWLLTNGTWTRVRDYSTVATWSWTPTAVGNYSVQVRARGAGIVTAYEAYSVQTFTVTAVPIVSNVNMTVDKVSPQVTGTAVTFTATANGGTAPQEYEFWLNNGSTWTRVQNYSATNTWGWTPGSAGSYQIQVRARSAGSTAAYEAFLQQAYTVTAPVVVPASVNMTTDKVTPQVAGTTITFTASSGGVNAPAEYEFWLNGGSAWTKVQNYSTTNTWGWTPATAGTYQIQVRVRGAGSTAAYEAFSQQAYTVTAPVTVSSVSFAADKATPQTPGTIVTFTATAVGGTAPQEYEFWLNNGTTWTKVQNYSTTNTWSWTPAAVGTYQIQVRAKSSGSTAAYDAFSQQAYVVTKVSSVSLTTDKVSPQPVATTVTFSSSATGGIAPQEYEFWLYNGTWTKVQNYSATSSWSWTPVTPGTYQIQVRGRSAGATAPYEAYLQQAFTIQ